MQSHKLLLMVKTEKNVNLESLAALIERQILGTLLVLVLNSADYQMMVVLQADTFPMLDKRFNQIQQLAGVFEVSRYFVKPKIAKRRPSWQNQIAHKR